MTVAAKPRSNAAARSPGNGTDQAAGRTQEHQPETTTTTESHSSTVLPLDENTTARVPAVDQMACYAGVPTEVVEDCERIHTTVRAVRLEGLRRIRDLLAPYGTFKQWCHDHEENYGSIQYQLSQAYGNVSKRTIEQNSIAGLLEGSVDTTAQSVIRAQAERVRVLEAKVQSFESMTAAQLMAEAQRRETEEPRKRMYLFIAARMQLNMEKTGDPLKHMTSTTEPGKIIDADPTLEGMLTVFRDRLPMSDEEGRKRREDEFNAHVKQYAERFEAEALAEFEADPTQVITRPEDPEVMERGRQLAIAFGGLRALMAEDDLRAGVLARRVRRAYAGSRQGQAGPYLGWCITLVQWLGIDVSIANIRKHADVWERYEAIAAELELTELDPVGDVAGWVDEDIMTAAIRERLTWAVVQRLDDLRVTETDPDADDEKGESEED